MVMVAFTASPGTSPVSAITPVGVSTAITTLPKLFMIVIASKVRPRGGPFKPCANTSVNRAAKLHFGNARFHAHVGEVFE